jgi:hypothetical protein
VTIVIISIGIASTIIAHCIVVWNRISVAISWLALHAVALPTNGWLATSGNGGALTPIQRARMCLTSTCDGEARAQLAHLRIEGLAGGFRNNSDQN